MQTGIRDEVHEIRDKIRTETRHERDDEDWRRKRSDWDWHSYTGTFVTRVQDGKMVEQWVNFDVLSLLQQIGAVPTPG